MLEKVWRKRNLPVLFVGVKIDIATMENSMEVPSKLKIELQYDTAVPLLGIYLEKKHDPKGYMHPNVHCSTVYNSQDMEAT